MGSLRRIATFVLLSGPVLGVGDATVKVAPTLSGIGPMFPGALKEHLRVEAQALLRFCVAAVMGGMI